MKTAFHSQRVAKQQQRALDLPVTDADLRRAYDRTQLKHLGVSYEAAVEDPSIRIALNRVARALNNCTPRFKWGRR